MQWLTDPFQVSFVSRALCAGILVSLLCAVTGTWVVLRGMTFLGDAMSHGMLPGVAIAALLGAHPMLGAAVSAGSMALGMTALSRLRRLTADATIGLLFVGALSVGVIVVSRSESFAVDLTAILFGDVLAVRDADLAVLAAALAATVLISIVGYRSFVALSFDERKAHTLGLHPRSAHALLLVLLTLAIVAAFHVVGTLLVFGLLIAPPATALLWAKRISSVMIGAAVTGMLSTTAGLLVSWHAGTAAGATIVATAVVLFVLSASARYVRRRLRPALPVTALALAALVAGCGTTNSDAPGQSEAAESKPDVSHGYVEGAEETAEVGPRLVVADADTGVVRVMDLSTGDVTEAARVDGVTGVVGDGRFAFVSADGATRVVDGGSWKVDHGDHVHYYRADVRDVGTLPKAAAVQATSDTGTTALGFADGSVVTVDRAELAAGAASAEPPTVPDAVAAVPWRDRLLVATPRENARNIEIRTREGTTVAEIDRPCPDPRGVAVTRRGVVFGCSDGALVVSDTGSGFTATTIAYPDAVADTDRASQFRHRPSATTLAAIGGNDTVWALDVAARRWTRISSGPVAAVNAVGEGGPVLALTTDGVLHSYDPVSGNETARTPLLDPATMLTGGLAPNIVVDTSRAYVNDAAAGTIHEIDYNDRLRHARALRVGGKASYIAGTGQ